MPSYKVVYFDGRGRAELARLILTASGTPFEDVRVKDWPNGKDQAPLGQLPYLVVDDLRIPQSVSIARFLARRFNLAGRDELEQVKADVIVDTLSDLRNAFYQKVFMAKDDQKEEAKTKFLEDAKLHLGRVEKLVSQYGSNGHAVGSALTWADLELFEVTTILVGLYPTVLDGHTSILGVRKSVEGHEKVGPYIKNRPVTPF